MKPKPFDYPDLSPEQNLKLHDIRRQWWARHGGHPLCQNLDIGELLGRSLPIDRDGTVVIGDGLRESAWSEEKSVALDAFLKRARPWKKGPFAICGTEIDAEWRSDWKWQRIAPHLADLRGKRVADIGANNGYFMLRMLGHRPELVVGFEPVAVPYLSFLTMQSMCEEADSLVMEPLGVEDIDCFGAYFDVIFCMGIIYHQRDPIGMLRNLARALRPGGQLILESMAIPGDEDWALCPKDRYARAKGVWFVPTSSCLMNWLRRSFFVDAKCVFEGPLSVEEQRRTVWADIESLKDFLTDDLSKTVEGYPAPTRVYITARRSPTVR